MARVPSKNAVLKKRTPDSNSGRFKDAVFKSASIDDAATSELPQKLVLRVVKLSSKSNTQTV